MKLEQAIELIVNGPNTDPENEVYRKSMDRVRALLDIPDVAKLVDAALDLHARKGVPLVHALMVCVQFGYQLRFLTESEITDQPRVNAAEIVERTLASLGLSGNSTH